MKRTIVFRTVGDSEYGQAAIDGMVKALTSDELDTVKAELAKLRDENAQLGVRKVRDKKRYSNKMRRLRRKYNIKQPGKAAQTALLVWTLTSLTICECCRRLIGRGA